MPYTERQAEAFLQAKEQERQQAQEPHGVLVQGTDPGVRGEINWPEGQKPSGEDPLFKSITGDSKEFVGGMPKETWDNMGPEAQRQWSQMNKPLQTIIRGTGSAVVGAPMAAAGLVAGTAAGAALGASTGGPLGAAGLGVIGGVVGATAGGNFGGQVGSEIADSYIQDFNKAATPPATRTRENLYKEYTSAIGRE